MIATRPFRHLCPEADKRDAMSDGEFWDYVLCGIEPGTTFADMDEAPEVELEPYQLVPCPECGGYGACGWDDEGRPLIHATTEADDG